MQRFHQVLFILALLGLCWLAMMAVHELGHLLGALATGGVVERVVLHPLALSRTDVSPNPHPGFVVWLGPLTGSLLPVAISMIVPKGRPLLSNIAKFFAGFCLIANGAYIALGSFDRLGDCGEMHRTGTPHWAMLLFGAATIPLGFELWHRLGSLRVFLNNPAAISPRAAYLVFGALAVTAAAGLVFSPFML